jgi:hypothetical protein
MGDTLESENTLHLQVAVYVLTIPRAAVPVLVPTLLWHVRA